MGKGLSKLQKGLLLMALKNSRRVDGERERAFCERLDRRDIGKGDLPHLTTYEALQGCTHAGARVSISRAFARLKERGLVEVCYQEQMTGHLLWSGIYLTARGMEAAKELEGNG